MERLTRYMKSGKADIVAKKYREKAQHDAIQRLAAFEDAEEQGRLVMLPCKVGDTVYIIYPADCKSGECPDINSDACVFDAFLTPTEEVCQCREKHSFINEIEINEIRAVYDEYGLSFVVNDYYEFGNSEQIYLTRERAETELNGKPHG